MICLARDTGACGAGTETSLGSGAGLGSVLVAGLAAAFDLASDLAAGLALAAVSAPDAAAPFRFDSPRRCTLPITALRVTPPSSLAIWLADWPSLQSFLRSSTRSSLQDMVASYLKRRPVARAALIIPWSPYSNHSSVSYKASNHP